VIISAGAQILSPSNLPETRQSPPNPSTPGYPTGNNSVTGLPWSPGTDGLRNIIGVNNNDATATIYAVTSTVSGNGDQGADPNKVVVITDNIAATTLPTNESFTTFQAAAFGEVLRGVSFTPTH
jgi:hypothetical protein